MLLALIHVNNPFQIKKNAENKWFSKKIVEFYYII